MGVVRAGLIGAALVAAQETVTIRSPSSPPYGVSQSAGSFSGRGALLIDAVAWAYGTTNLFVDAPAWFRTERFDFQAPPNGQLAFRQALSDTFLLAVHRETRMVRTWVLHKMAPARELVAGDVSTGRAANRSMWDQRSGSITCKACSIDEDLAPILERVLAAPVLDETGIGGYYEFSVAWRAGTPESLAGALRDELGILLLQEYREHAVLVIDGAVNPFAKPAAEPPTYGCEAAPDLQRLLAGLPDIRDYRKSYVDRREPASALSRRFPDHLFAAMRAQDVFAKIPGWQRTGITPSRAMPGCRTATAGSFSKPVSGPVSNPGGRGASLRN